MERGLGTVSIHRSSRSLSVSVIKKEVRRWKNGLVLEKK